MQQGNVSGGSLKVSANVLVSIAEAAASEVEGVVITPANKLAVLVNAPIASQLFTPVKVRLGSESAAIELSIITKLGYKAYEVAKAVQENVKASVQNMTGITVSKVDIKIVAIRT